MLAPDRRPAMKWDRDCSLCKVTPPSSSAQTRFGAAQCCCWLLIHITTTASAMSRIVIIYIAIETKNKKRSFHEFVRIQHPSKRIHVLTLSHTPTNPKSNIVRKCSFEHAHCQPNNPKSRKSTIRENMVTTSASERDRATSECALYKWTTHLAAHLMGGAEEAACLFSGCVFLG